MRLLLDMGNSRVKWAWLEAGELRDPGSAPHGPDSLPAVLDAIGGGGGGAHVPAGIDLASVAGAAPTRSLADALAQRHGVPVRIAQAGVSAHGVRNGYREPRQLGVDRWLAMVGAYARHRRALRVVSAGTAVTIDAVAADGRHLGGYIVPGLALMRSALLRETGGIGAAAGLVAPQEAGAGRWGTDTESCMRLGALRALAALVEASAGEPAGDRPLLVVTGGDAPALLGTLAVPAEHRPLLVLEGLALCGEDAA